MQDIHLQICDGGVDRRLRPHHDDHSDLHGLKCPRCESVNTKFCYYNNYNLSQPRYFCKGCRRYWTKGGVLRNVPVGGGCRKAKRSKKTKPSQSAEPFGSVQLPRKRKSRSNSSSDSSTTAATASTATAAESLSAVNHSSSFDDGIFSEIGSFASLMASSGHQSLFAFNGVLDPTNHCHQQLKFDAEVNLEQGVKLPLPEIPTTEGRFPDQNVFEVDLPLPLRSSSNGGFGPLDWQPNADQGLFDFPNAVDQAYWPSQSSQWTDVDQPGSLYLP